GDHERAAMVEHGAGAVGLGLGGKGLGRQVPWNASAVVFGQRNTISSASSRVNLRRFMISRASRPDSRDSRRSSPSAPATLASFSLLRARSSRPAPLMSSPDIHAISLCDPLPKRMEETH